MVLLMACNHGRDSECLNLLDSDAAMPNPHSIYLTLRQCSILAMASKGYFLINISQYFHHEI